MNRDILYDSENEINKIKEDFTPCKIEEKSPQKSYLRDPTVTIIFFNKIVHAWVWYQKK